MPLTPNTAVGPYSPIRKAGDFYFISGVTGIDVATKTASPDIAAQTTQAFENMKQVLESAGLTLNNVVKTGVFLTDMGDFAAMNDVYAEQFAPPLPPRSTVAVSELPRVANVPLKVEIEAVALAHPTDTE